MRPRHHFPAPRPRIQWVFFALDAVGLIAFVAACFYAVPFVAAILGVMP